MVYQRNVVNKIGSNQLTEQFLKRRLTKYFPSGPLLNPSPMEAAILDVSGPVRSRHLGDDSGQVWLKLAQ
jgi:hypothetical protein